MSGLAFLANPKYEVIMSENKEPKYFYLRDWLLFCVLAVGFSINNFGFTLAALLSSWGVICVIALLVVTIVYFADKFNGNP